jgi:WD40 repeat protein/beta-lactamase regulating signal transducer with metallopeptidase domain
MSFPDSVLAGASWAGVVLVQVTLAALLGLLAWLALRRGSPALRGAVLVATLAGLLVVPGLNAVTPIWLPLPEWLAPTAAGPTAAGPEEAGRKRLPTPTATPAVLAVVVERPSANAAPALEDPAKQAADTAREQAKARAVLHLPLAADDPAPAARPEDADLPSRRSWSGSSLIGVLAAVWLAGALVCLARALVRLALLYRWAWQACPVREPGWTDCVASLAKGYGLPAVALRESPALKNSPLTLGLFRPVILLPRGRRAWSEKERALILGHELAHVARRDFLAGLLAEPASCLCWFHPLVRWLAARLRLEQEYAADAWVASAMGDSKDYVRCLARLALSQGRGTAAPAPSLWRRRPEILRRIDMLRRNPEGRPPHLGRRTGWTLAALTAAACLAVAGVGPLRSAAEAPKPADNKVAAKAAADPQSEPLPAGALARLGTTRLRHDADVTFVAFGPDATKLITAGRDGTVRVWDLATRREVRRFDRPRPVAPKIPAKNDKKAQRDAFKLMMAGARGAGGNFGVAVAPDGKTLAAHGGNVIQLWQVETGKELVRIPAPPSGIAGLLFSSDGRTLAGRAFDGSLFLWSAQTGKQLHAIQAPQRRQDGTFILTFGGGGGDPAPGMAFTPDGKLLAAAATDYQKQEVIHSVKFWDVATGKEARKVKVPAGAAAAAVAVSPDGKLLAYGAGGVRLCEADTGKEVHHLKGDGAVAALAFSPDSTTLAVRAANQRVRLWDAKTGKQLRQLSDAEPPRQVGGGFFIVTGGITSHEARALAFSPDGKRVASAAAGTIRLWEADTGNEVPLRQGHWRSPSAVVLSPDGKTAVSWGADRVVRSWEAATGKPLGAFAAPAGTRMAAFSGDGRTVALANADNTIRLHDTTTGKEVSRLKGHPGGTTALAFAPDGKVLASRGRGDNTVRLHDVVRGVELRQLTIEPKRRPQQGMVIILGFPGQDTLGTGPGLAFSPDGKLVVAPLAANGDRSNTLVLLDTATGKQLRKIESPRPIVSYAFSPDGRSIAAENTDRTVTLWEVASGKEQGRLGEAVAGQPQPGGARMALNVAVEGFPGPSAAPGGPVGLSFSPDGRTLAVRGAAGLVRFWDLAADKEAGRLKGHAGRVATVAFGPGGKTLASGSDDTTILLWDTAGIRKGLSKPPAVELTAADLDELWGTLAGADAVKARQGVRKLAGAAGQAVPFLGKHLKPAARVDPRKIDGWIADLESEKFAVRKAAIASLLKTGEQAVPALKKVLASKPPLETRKRVEELLDQLTGGTLTGEQLRVVRAVEALERIGTPEAKRLLRSLADGAPGALPTLEAQAALDRLKDE